MKNKEIELLRRKVKETKSLIDFDDTEELRLRLSYLENKLEECYERK